jgi:hypothetical protein
MKTDKKLIIPFKSPEKHYESDACIIWCFDARFSELYDKLDLLGWKKRDLIKVAGGAKELVSDGPGKDFILDQISKSVRLHRPKIIVLMVHKNCGAYGKLNVADEELFMSNELKKAEAAVSRLLHSISYEAEVKTFYADFNGLYLVK